MKKAALIVGLIAACTTMSVFAQTTYDPVRVREAYKAADDGMSLTESMHKDTVHNFGGHMWKARQAFAQAHAELEQAERYAAAHGEVPGAGN